MPRILPVVRAVTTCGCPYSRHGARPVDLGEVLELTDLARRYGDVVALDGVSFSVAPGQLFGFVGPNGAGKTTTMRIVLGVLAADRGEVRWRGRAGRRRDCARASATCPRSAACTRRCACATSCVYLARLHGATRAPTAAAGRAAGSSGSALAERAGDRGRGRSRSATSSACSSRRRSSTTRSCWCSTSRSPAWTRSASTCSAACCASTPPTGVPGRVLQPPARPRRAALRGGRDRQGRPRSSPAARVDELRGSATAARVRVAVAGADGDGWLAALPAAEAGRRAARRLAARRPARRRRRRDDVLDAARARRRGHPLQPRAADADRPVPQGGGGVRRAAVRLVARRELDRARARERSFLVGTASRSRSSRWSSCCRRLLGFGEHDDRTRSRPSTAPAAAVVRRRPARGADAFDVELDGAPDERGARPRRRLARRRRRRRAGRRRAARHRRSSTTELRRRAARPARAELREAGRATAGAPRRCCA